MKQQITILILTMILRRCRSFSSSQSSIVRRSQRRRLAFLPSGQSISKPSWKQSQYQCCPLVIVPSFSIIRERRLFFSSRPAVLDDDDLDDASTTVQPSSRTATQTVVIQPAETHLLHPGDLCENGCIPYPKALSPSAIMEFKKCPQSFLFQYLLGLKQPTSLALAKGSMCHTALEKLFDLEPQQRTLQVLQDLFRTAWAQHRDSATYRILFEKPIPHDPNSETDDNTTTNDNHVTVQWDLDAEREWGRSGLKLLENYYQLEDPRTIVRPNPVKREIWLNAHLSIDPALGATANTQASNIHNSSENLTNHTIGEEVMPTFHVRGIVDRLDMVRTRDSSPQQVCLRIVDYKTGKAPNLKYSQTMNEKIMNEAFYQLKIYALLLREKGAGKEFAMQASKMDVRLLRLLYLTSEAEKAVHWDMDMGSTQEERDALLQEVHRDLSNVWMEIVELVSRQDPKAFVGCDRSFCYCHQCRPKFVPGTVWEPSP